MENAKMSSYFPGEEDFYAKLNEVLQDKHLDSGVVCSSIVYNDVEEAYALLVMKVISDSTNVPDQVSDAVLKTIIDKWEERIFTLAQPVEASTGREISLFVEALLMTIVNDIKRNATAKIDSNILKNVHLRLKKSIEKSECVHARGKSDMQLKM